MGKIKKHTEYYCDVCGCKITESIFSFSRYKFYKIKSYDHEGDRIKTSDYDYVCNECMSNIIREVSKRRKKND